MCNHELKYLVGVAGGVICRNCGQRFDHIPKQEAPKAEKPKTEKPAEEKPKKAPAKKPASRKGATK